MLDKTKTNYANLSMFEKQQLKNYIIDLFVTSRNTKEICEKVIERYNLTDNNAIVQKLVKEAKQEFFDVEVEECRENKRYGYLAQYQNLLKLAVDKAAATGNTKNAKELIDSMVKLEGLLTEKQEVKVVDEFTVEF